MKAKNDKQIFKEFELTDSTIFIFTIDREVADTEEKVAKIVELLNFAPSGDVFVPYPSFSSLEDAKSFLKEAEKLGYAGMKITAIPLCEKRSSVKVYTGLN